MHYSRVCAEHFTEDSFEQKSFSKEFVGTLFQPFVNLQSRKTRAVPTINFTVDPCKPANGQKTTNNKRIMTVEQWVNSSAISQVT